MPMKFSMEGDGAEIVSVLRTLQGPVSSGTDPFFSFPPAVAEVEKAEIEVEAQASPSPSEATVRAGCDVWYGIIHTWAQGFGEEGVEQPDRGQAIFGAMTTNSADIFAFLRYCDGLTRLVRTIRPDWSVVKARLIAENIASVCGALGIPGIADHLEYTKEYTREALGT